MRHYQYIAFAKRHVLKAAIERPPIKGRISLHAFDIVARLLKGDLKRSPVFLQIAESR
jgi:hypothetical protein